MTHPRYISFNGDIVPWEDAKIHVMSPAVKYGAGVFEGIRGYWNAAEERLHLFRLGAHLDRLHYSMRVMRFDHGLSHAVLQAAIIDLLRANALRQDVHIRPLVWVDGAGDMNATGPIGWMVSALPAGPQAAVRTGIHLATASWRRIADTAMPARVKATANYVNGRLAGLEAAGNGFGGSLLLTQSGHVAEAPGACFFMIRDGKPATPAPSNAILESITRATVMTLLAEMGLPTAERDIDRTEVYAADEAFLCGSGAEIQPVLSLDRLTLGDGAPGRLTQQLQARYFAVVRGDTPDHAAWRTTIEL